MTADKVEYLFPLNTSSLLVRCLPSICLFSNNFHQSPLLKIAFSDSNNEVKKSDNQVVTKCPGCSGPQNTAGVMCDSCEKKFNTVSVTLNKVTKCPYCHKYQSDIKEHLKNNDEKKEVCPKCSYSTSNKNCLKTHLLQIHEIDKGYLFCGICDISFSEKPCLEYHTKLMHAKQNQEEIKCFICLKKFKNQQCLKIHQMKTKGKKYQCHICKIETTKQICLTNHLAEVHRENIKCQLCDTNFKTTLSMKLHICNAKMPIPITNIKTELPDELPE